jgi:hypothetical protein
MHQTGAIREICTALTHADDHVVRSERPGDVAFRIVEQATRYETCQQSVDAQLQCAASLGALIIAAGEGHGSRKSGLLDAYSCGKERRHSDRHLWEDDRDVVCAGAVTPPMC